MVTAINLILPYALVNKSKIARYYNCSRPRALYKVPLYVPVKVYCSFDIVDLNLFNDFCAPLVGTICILLDTLQLSLPAIQAF
jgi:hypothetical protein